MEKLTEKQVSNFLKHVNKTDTCWIWIGCQFKDGYGQVRINKIAYRAHRVSYFIYKGEFNNLYQICHNCPNNNDNRLCVNPNHLYLGTQSDNMIDVVIKHRNPKQQKLTIEQVYEIRKLLKENQMSGAAIGDKFNVSTSTISLINRNKTYYYL